MGKRIHKTDKTTKQKTESPKLYVKGDKLLVEDGFDWVNPKASKVSRPLLLHGTSKSLVSRIKEEGLVYKCPLLTTEELNALKRQYISENGSSIPTEHTVNVSGRISLALNPSVALDHAIKGPEILSRIHFTLNVYKKAGMEIPDGIMKILSKLDDFYSNHVPVILLIDCPLYKPNYDILERLKKHWNSNKKPETLTVELDYLLALKRRGKVTEKEAIQLGYGEYPENCYAIDLPDDTVIPPENIKAIIEVTDELKV